MPYVPTKWKTGDVVTAEKLNKLENIFFYVGAHPSIPNALDKTCNELKQAYLAGKMIILHTENKDSTDGKTTYADYMATGISWSSNSFDIYIVGERYHNDTNMNGYPTLYT